MLRLEDDNKACKGFNLPGRDGAVILISVAVVMLSNWRVGGDSDAELSQLTQLHQPVRVFLDANICGDWLQYGH